MATLEMKQNDTINDQAVTTQPNTSHADAVDSDDDGFKVEAVDDDLSDIRRENRERKRAIREAAEATAADASMPDALVPKESNTVGLDESESSAAPTIPQAQRQPRRRFKFYMEYVTDDLRKQLTCKLRLPRNGKWEDGPSVEVKRLFVAHYNEARPGTPLEAELVHLETERKLALADEDSVTGFMEPYGTLLCKDGPSPIKRAEAQVYWWGQHPTVREMEFHIPMQIDAFARKRVAQVSIGWLHATVLTEGRMVFSWGSNAFGQLGTGDENPRSEPVLVTELTEQRIKHVQCGSFYTAAITTKGELWTWGRYQCSNWPKKFVDTWCNGYGDDPNVGLRGKKVRKIACGESHLAALCSTGCLYTWGYNENSQLGWGEAEAKQGGQKRPRPVELPGGEVVMDVDAGGQHTLVVCKSGKVYGWGSNAVDQIGAYLRTNHHNPTEVRLPEGDKATAVACGRYSSLVLTWDGKVFQWGAVRVNSSQSSQAAALQTDDAQDDESPLVGSRVEAGSVARLGGSANMIATRTKSFALGEAHGLLVGHDDGVSGFGYNNYGQATGSRTRDSFVEIPMSVHKLGPSPFRVVESIAVGGGQSLVMVQERSQSDGP